MKTKSARPRILIISLLLGLVVAYIIWPRGGESEFTQIQFSEFNDLIDTGTVTDIEMIEGPNLIRGVTSEGLRFETTYLSPNADEITELVLATDPAINLQLQKPGGSIWGQLFIIFAPIVLLVFLFVIVLRVLNLGGNKKGNYAKTKARKSGTDLPKITFDDVAGADEAVEELREIKEFLEDPVRFYSMGAKIPKGVLLYGPPGTGKTLLARAVAGEAGVPFFSISGSDFVEMFVGVGASRVRDLFNQAKEEAPAIVFVDEIDAVGRHRGAGVGGGHDEREQTLNQLLVEMDGFDATTGVIMIAATNRPDILDPALLRPGRFDRQIAVDSPDLSGRNSILGVHSAGKPLADDVELDTIARRTPGFTGADLQNLMNESALLAARRRQPDITMDLVEESIDRVMAGPQRKSRVLGDHERRVIAYHEAGHALVGHVLKHTDPIHKVSIIARGRALGWTLALPDQDKYLRTRSQLHDDMAMLLGGRTAEEMIFDDPTTGASDDIERVSNLARAMVTQYGMSDRVGPQQLGKAQGEVFLGKNMTHEANYSDSIASLIDDEVDNFITQAHQEAEAILTTHIATLDALAEALLERETLNREDLAEIFEGLETWERSEPLIDLTAEIASEYGDFVGPEPVGAGDARAMPRDLDRQVRPLQNRLPSEPSTDEHRRPKF